MKKHQYAKQDCNCLRRATYFVCKHCGAVEFCSVDEVKTMPSSRAFCTSSDAPDVGHAECFKCRLGGTLDCLAPDFETWDRDRRARGEEVPSRK